MALSFLVLPAIIAVTPLQSTASPMATPCTQVSSRCAKPTISVLSRCVTTTYITVRISTGGRPWDANLRYTLDGSDPKLNGTPIANGGSVNVPAGGTLTARAFKRCWFPSNIAVATYYCQ